MSVLPDLAAALGSGTVEVVDLTAPLSSGTPTLKLPPQFGQTATLEVDHIRAWERENGPLPGGGWLLYRTGWDARSHLQDAFLNADENGPHTPGVSIDCARWLADESPIVGLGVETVGTDAGAAAGFDPSFPCHTYLHGAGKY